MSLGMDFGTVWACSSPPTPVHYLLSVFVVEDVIFHLSDPVPMPDACCKDSASLWTLTSSLWNHKPLKTHSSLSCFWSQYFITINRKITNTNGAFGFTV